MNPQFEKAGVIVVGISPDSIESHRRFIRKHGLPFALLSDSDHAVAEAYGVWGEKTFMGRKFLGVIRSSFLIGTDGRLEQIWRNVKAEPHPAHVLAELRSNPS